jgi:hypothetical protein
VSYRLVENNRKLRALYGRYQEIYNWVGLSYIGSIPCCIHSGVVCRMRNRRGGSHSRIVALFDGLRSTSIDFRVAVR